MTDPIAEAEDLYARADAIADQGQAPTPALRMHLCIEVQRLERALAKLPSVLGLDLDRETVAAEMERRESAKSKMQELKTILTETWT